jgi:hypothetical protein
MWKNESAEVKKQYKDKADEAMEVWKKEMIEWTNKQSIDKEAELAGIHKMNDRGSSKRKCEKSDAGNESSDGSNENESPRKKRRNLS